MEDVRKAGDYTVLHAMYIGHKEIVLCENADAKPNERYLCCYVENIAMDGYPICSDENGYWYAEHQHEINRTVRRFNQCITHMSVVRNGLLDSKIIEEGNLHIELRVIMKPPKGGRTIGQ